MSKRKRPFPKKPLPIGFHPPSPDSKPVTASRPGTLESIVRLAKEWAAENDQQDDKPEAPPETSVNDTFNLTEILRRNDCLESDEVKFVIGGLLSRSEFVTDAIRDFEAPDTILKWLKDVAMGDGTSNDSKFAAILMGLILNQRSQERSEL